MTTFEALSGATKEVREAIRSSGNAEAVAVESFLDLSARHVLTAGLGPNLFQASRNPPKAGPLAVESATIETAALMLVFGSGQTSIDHCATALLRWHGVVPTKPDREHDFASLRHRVGDATVTLSAKQRGWFDAVDSTQEGKQLEAFRHAVVHRVVRQDIQITIGSGYSAKLSPSTATPGTQEADVLLEALAQFVEDRWRQFWAALA